METSTDCIGAPGTALEIARCLEKGNGTAARVGMHIRWDQTVSESLQISKTEVEQVPLSPFSVKRKKVACHVD